MKYFGYFLVLGSIPLVANVHYEEFKIILEPRWENIEHNQQKNEQFGGKWILAGSITFKKNSNELVNLSTLELHWDEEKKLDNLIASLYKKNLDKEFMAIEDNLICDGQWNKTEQTLLFSFNKKQNLGITNIFYLVLTVPNHLENILKKGRFSLKKNKLPEQFNLSSKDQTLSLVFNTPN